MLEIKNITWRRVFLMGSSKDLTWVRKKSVQLKIHPLEIIQTEMQRKKINSIEEQR